MVNNILTSSYAVEFVYPFLLIFTIIFAILEKSKILGEEKKQIDAIVSLVVALVAVASINVAGIIANLMPVLAVIIIIIFIFLVIWGFISNEKQGLTINKGLQITIGIVSAIVLIIAIIIVTGQWNIVVATLFSREFGQSIWGNILMLVIIGGAIAIVLNSGKGSKSES